MIKCHLSKLMGMRKHSIQDVHELTGLGRTTIHRLYHETNDAIRYETIEKICVLYKCKIGDVLEWVPEAESPDGKDE